jgi:cysteine-rich repeat protein
VRIFDSFGAATDILSDTLTVGEESVGTGRRLLATSAELFNKAKAKMADNLKAFSASKVNRLAVSMAAEGGQRLDRSAAMALKGELMAQIQEGTQKAIGTTAYACETFSAGAVVSDSPSAMNADAVLNVARVLANLANAKGTVLDQQCVNAAVAMAGSSLVAQVLGSGSIDGTQGVGYMNELLEGMQGVMKQAVATSAVGEPASVFESDGNVQTVSKLTLQALMGSTLLTLSPSASSILSSASFTVPRNLAAIFGDSMTDMILHQHSLTTSPASPEGTIMVSPLYGLTLLYANNGSEARVQDLSEPFVIEIPVDLRRLTAIEQMLFPQQVACVYWSGHAYVSDGCNVTNVTDTKVTCSCNHLTTFGVNQDPRLPACGDSKRSLVESCDDGNTASGDGCSDSCTIEKNWDCFGDVGFGSTCLSKDQPTNQLIASDGVRTTMQFGGFDSETQVLGFLKSLQNVLGEALAQGTGGPFSGDNVVILKVCYLADVGCTVINKEPESRRGVLDTAWPAEFHSDSSAGNVTAVVEHAVAGRAQRRLLSAATDISMHIATPGSITPASAASFMSNPDFLTNFASTLGAAIKLNLTVTYKVPPTMKMAPRAPEPPLVIAPFLKTPKPSDEVLQEQWVPPENRQAIGGLSPILVGLIAAGSVLLCCAGLIGFFIVPCLRRIISERRRAKVKPVKFDSPEPKEPTIMENTPSVSAHSARRMMLQSPEPTEEDKVNDAGDDSMNNATEGSMNNLTPVESIVEQSDTSLSQEPNMAFTAVVEEATPLAEDESETSLVVPITRSESMDELNERTEASHTAPVALAPSQPPGAPTRPSGRYGKARARLQDLQAQLVSIFIFLLESSGLGKSSAYLKLASIVIACFL